MRISELETRPIYELTLCLTTGEARQAIAMLEQLLADAESQGSGVSENEFDDALSPTEGGQRLVRLVVYADPDFEQTYDAKLATAGS